VNMLIQVTTKFFKIVTIFSLLVSAMPRHYSNEERTNAIDDAVVSESREAHLLTNDFLEFI
jgi:hypothetical protein